MSIRAISNVILVVLFASALGVPASGYMKHVRYFASNAAGENSAQNLSFIMETSLGNPENPKRFYVENVELSVLVDPASDRIDPKLLAREDSVELSFMANDLYWSIEPKSCTPQDALPNKEWLFCTADDGKTGFVIETKPGDAGGPILHFGKVRQNSSSALPALVTYGELPDLLVKDKGEAVTNRLVVSDDRADLISIEMTDAQPSN